MRRLLTSLTSLLILAAALSCLAQAQDPPPTPELTPGLPPPPPADYQPDGPIHTLHVYIDLIQVPVLVLDSEQGRMKPVDASKFVVELDGGRPFRPKRVRQQGDDPITLGILLDPSTEPALMPKIGAALAALAPGSLNPKDHVTIYAMDCDLVRTLDDAPADPVALQHAVDSALANWSAQRKARKDKRPVTACANPIDLWDSMSVAAKRLARAPGRRILLTLSSGIDGGSRIKPEDLRQYAQLAGIAIFGYSTHYASSIHGSVFIGFRTPRLMSEAGPVDQFNAVCQLSGGVVLPADPDYLPRQLDRFVTTVRERYIVEFSRPRNYDTGIHGIIVSLPKVDSGAYIRPAGVTVVGLDRSLIDDPDTIRRDASDAPEMGKSRPKQP